MRTLLWFRGRDFRLEHQLALAAAAETEALIPAVALDPRPRGSWLIAVESLAMHAVQRRGANRVGHRFRLHIGDILTIGGR